MLQFIKNPHEVILRRDLYLTAMTADQNHNEHDHQN